MKETISFKCHAGEPSRDGTEVFTCVRAIPRITIAGSFKFLKNVSDDALAALYENSDDGLRVPAWMHPLKLNEAGELQSDALVNIGESNLFWLRDAETKLWSFVECNTAGAFPVPLATLDVEGYDAGFPVLQTRLADTTTSVEYVTPTVRTTSLGFTAFEHKESLPELWDGETLPGRVNGATPLGLSLSYAENLFDQGNLTTRALRYSKRAVKLSLWLGSRLDITTFRDFVFRMKGRSGRCFLRTSADADVKPYRLASDDVTLDYVKPSLASCELSLIELPY